MLSRLARNPELARAILRRGGLGPLLALYEGASKAQGALAGRNTGGVQGAPVGRNIGGGRKPAADTGGVAQGSGRNTGVAQRGRNTGGVPLSSGAAGVSSYASAMREASSSSSAVATASFRHSFSSLSPATPTTPTASTAAGHSHSSDGDSSHSAYNTAAASPLPSFAVGTPGLHTTAATAPEIEEPDADKTLEAAELQSPQIAVTESDARLREGRSNESFLSLEEGRLQSRRELAAAYAAEAIAYLVIAAPNEGLRAELLREGCLEPLLVS